MKRLSQLLPNVIALTCDKSNFIQHKIIVEWEQIVGSHLATISMPIGTKFSKNKTNEGTLIVGVSNPAYVLELKMIEGLILHRLATYFGYPAIDKIRLLFRRSNCSVS